MSTGEFGPKCAGYFFSFFFRRVRGTSMTQRRVEITLHTLAHFRLYRLKSDLFKQQAYDNNKYQLIK